MDSVREAVRDIPVIREVDVCVVGGGTAGIAAGVTAARNGADTLVVERYNCLGGQMTAGYVVFIPGKWNYDVGSPTFGGIMTEIADRLRKEDSFWRLDGTPQGHFWMDGEVAKWLGIVMLEEAGAKLRLHSWVSNVVMDGNRIQAIIVESKEGRQAVVAKNFVDASGDADLFFFSGAGFETGNKRISLEGRVFVPDPDAWLTFMRGQDGKFREWLDENGIRSSFNARMHRRVGNIRLSTCGWPDPKSMSGDWDGLDVDVLTKIETESRKEYKKMIDFYRANVPGCADMIQIESSSQLGVRETRRALGDHILTQQEVSSRTRFDDCVGRCGTPDGYFEIPHRSIYSKDVDNLWVAGRCISADTTVWDVTRAIPTCALTGAATGIASALAVRQRDSDAYSLAVPELQQCLKDQGFLLDPALVKPAPE